MATIPPPDSFPETPAPGGTPGEVTAPPPDIDFPDPGDPGEFGDPGAPQEAQAHPS